MIGVVVCVTILAALLPVIGNGPSLSFAEGTTDLYFGTQGTPQGPPAPGPHETVYSRIGSFDSRLLVWFVINPANSSKAQNNGSARTNPPK